MSWYSKTKLIKTAAAKDKIKRYGIIDPSIKFLVHRYEKDLPWNEIAKIKKDGGSADGFIQEFVTNSLMPALGEKILGQNKPEDPNNYYFSPEFIKDRDVRIELNNTAAAQGMPPRDIEKSEKEGGYPDQLVIQSRALIEKDINDEKALQFNEWWGYMHEEQIYAQNPAFQYSVLKPIIDSSKSNKKNGSPPLNAEILASIWDDINVNGVDQMNIPKKYKKLTVKAEKDRAKAEQEPGTDLLAQDANWIRIKGGPSVDSPQELKDNIKRLKSLSQGTGWCTGRGHAAIYLPDGDFYLYLKNDKPVVATRLVGNKVAEIRGLNNDPKNLKPYWKEVTSFIPTTGIDYQNSEHYKMLEDIQMMNEEMIEGSPMYNKVLQKIRKNHKYYLQLSDKNKQNFIEFRQAAAVGYEAELEGILSRIEGANENTYLFNFSGFQDDYNDIPPGIKALLPDMQARVLQVHKKAYVANPKLFPEFAPEIQAMFSPEEQRDGWLLYIYADPYHYNDPNIPEEIKAVVDLNQVTNSWRSLLENSIDHVDHIHEDILPLFEQGEIENYILEDFAEYPTVIIGGRLVKLERMNNFIRQKRIDYRRVLQILADEIRNYPENTEWMLRLPPIWKEEIMKQTGVQTIIDEGNKSNIIKEPESFKHLDENSQNSLLQQYGQEITDAFVIKLKKIDKGQYDPWWESLPLNVRMYMPAFQRDTVMEMVKYYATQVRKNPNTIVPDDFQGWVMDEINKQGTNKNSWYKKATYELV
jgi:hypothetical protein